MPQPHSQIVARGTGFAVGLGQMLTARLQRKAHGLHRLVGNTPMLAIDYVLHGKQGTVYAKWEGLNLTGSIKDRMALHILECAYAEGRLAPGDTIAEATSGNTGISFSAIGRALGHPVTIFMPDWMSRERRELIASWPHPGNLGRVHPASCGSRVPRLHRRHSRR